MVGVIPRICGIDVEVKTCPVANRELADHRNVRVLEAGRTQIANRHRSGAGGILIDRSNAIRKGYDGLSKPIRVPLQEGVGARGDGTPIGKSDAGAAAIVMPQILGHLEGFSRYDVAASVEGAAAVGSPRCAGLQGYSCRELPLSKRFAKNRIARIPSLTLAYRQKIRHGCNETVRGIKIQKAVIVLQIDVVHSAGGTVGSAVNLGFGVRCAGAAASGA